MPSPLFHVPWYVWGILAALVALIFSFVWFPGPHPEHLSGFTWVIVRWFHPLVWGCLAISFLLRNTTWQLAPNLANLLAFAALILYLVYITTQVRVAS